MEKKKKEFNIGKTILIVAIIAIVLRMIMLTSQDDVFVINNNKLKVLSSLENQVLDADIMSYAKKNNLKIEIEYEDTLKIMSTLNTSDEYDAVWLSNSIWLYMIDSSKVSITNSKSTSINPIVFGIKKSKAESLGLINKTVYTKDIVNAIKEGNLKFNMANPTTTNSGASAYLGILSTLAGNPEVLTEEILDDPQLKEDLKTFFTGLERNSGDENFVEELFLNGDYEAVVSYESSIININKKLEAAGKEPLYAIYPVDGVSLSDSPIAYIDRKNDQKKEIFDNFQSYLLSNEGQELLADYGRRTWYGGINENPDEKIFNPKWGIDTKTYITPAKYPSTQVIKKALSLYQSELRKPIHVVFCLDYSGSMTGNGIEELRDAMDYILTDRAATDLLQFTAKDKIDVVTFQNIVGDIWSTDDGTKTQDMLNLIKEKRPVGSTALYDAAIKALEILSTEDTNVYNTSVILMTDGQANVGVFYDLRKAYNRINKDIPIY